ncbi:MAG: molybdate ABC transporter substrate-binding protein [Alphaproteobacteria bacterium]
MPKPIRIFAALLCCLLAGMQGSAAFPSVTVMSDKSINNAIIAIARNYSLENNTVVNTAFTTPDVQQQQIMDGSAADIVITPQEEWIEELKTLGLVDVYSKTEIASNRLALVTSANNTLTATLANGFPTADIIRSMDWQPAFVIGNPQTQMEGIYAKQALRSMNVASDLEEFTLYIRRYDEMLEAIAQRDAFGIFFYTSVRNKKDIRVIDFFPEDTYDPVRYYAVVIAGDNMNEARKFLNYLTQKDARRTLLGYGFVINQ